MKNRWIVKCINELEESVRGVHIFFQNLSALFSTKIFHTCLLFEEFVFSPGFIGHMWIHGDADRCDRYLGEVRMISNALQMMNIQLSLFTRSSLVNSRVKVKVQYILQALCLCLCYGFREGHLLFWKQLQTYFIHSVEWFSCRVSVLWENLNGWEVRSSPF